MTGSVLRYGGKLQKRLRNNNCSAPDLTLAFGECPQMAEQLLFFKSETRAISGLMLGDTESARVWERLLLLVF